MIHLTNECICKDYKNTNYSTRANHWSSHKLDDRTLFDVDFKFIDKEADKGRCIYYTHTCDVCRGLMVNGESFTDYRVTGKELILNAILKVMNMFSVPVYVATEQIEFIYKSFYYKTKYVDFFDELKLKYPLHTHRTKLFFQDSRDEQIYPLLDIRGHHFSSQQDEFVMVPSGYIKIV